MTTHDVSPSAAAPTHDVSPSAAAPTAPTLPALPDAPVTPDGRLAIGRFAGAFDTVRWGYPTGWLDGQVKRALGRKRWFQATILSPERVVVVRILDQGLVGSGLVWVADPRTGRTELEQHLTGVPLANLAVGPVAGRGTHAYVSLPTSRILLRRHEDANDWHLEVHLPGNALSLSLETRRAPTPLTQIHALRDASSTPEPTRGILVQRHVGLEVRGTVRFRSEVVPLQGATAILEYGNGFVLSPVEQAPEDVAWSSAIVSPVGGDDVPWVVATDLGDGGAFVWRDGAPTALADEVSWQSSLDRSPWRIRSNTFDLEFQPRCVSTEESRPPALLSGVSALKPVTQALAMRHALVVGTFEGTLTTADGPRSVRALGFCEARGFGL